LKRIIGVLASFTILGPLVQSPISANPGLNFNLLFLFMYFCMIIRFKTLENKTSIESEKISGKYIQLD
jgi:hypothetical protein